MMQIKKIGAIAAAVAAVVAFSAGSAFALNLMDLHNSPLLSLLAIKNAYQKHDVAAFQQHIDLERFIGRVYDDGLAAVDESGKSAFVTYSAKTGIYGVIKPYAVSFAQKKVLEDVRFGRKTESGTKASNKSNIFLDKGKAMAEKINPANILRNTIDLDNCELKKVATHEKTDTEAIVAATIYDTKLKQDFILRLKLAPLPGGKGWKVLEPMNFKEYALEIDRAKKTKVR